MWFWYMVLACAVVYYWKAALIIAGTVAVYVGVVHWHDTRQERKAREKRDAEARTARLIAHADREHKLVQEGDVDGIYGAYPVPDETRGTGIWLADDKKRPRTEPGPLRDIGFAG